VERALRESNLAGTVSGMATDRPSIEITEKHTPGAAAPRLAAVLGWDSIPEPTPEQEREVDGKLAAARLEAERVYGTDRNVA
jgi:hypothetical protein